MLKNRNGTLCVYELNMKPLPMINIRAIPSLLQPIRFINQGKSGAGMENTIIHLFIENKRDYKNYLPP